MRQGSPSSSRPFPFCSRRLPWFLPVSGPRCEHEALPPLPASSGICLQSPWCKHFRPARKPRHSEPRPRARRRNKRSASRRLAQKCFWPRASGRGRSYNTALPSTGPVLPPLPVPTLFCCPQFPRLGQTLQLPQPRSVLGSRLLSRFRALGDPTSHITRPRGSWRPQTPQKTQCINLFPRKKPSQSPNLLQSQRQQPAARSTTPNLSPSPTCTPGCLQVTGAREPAWERGGLRDAQSPQGKPCEVPAEAELGPGGFSLPKPPRLCPTAQAPSPYGELGQPHGETPGGLLTVGCQQPVLF